MPADPSAAIADFIGSLNAIEITVEELVGAYAVMRIGERERVVVPVGSETRTDDSFRIAVRPERIQIGPVDSAAPDVGTRLEGTISEIIYPGMYTQFHVTTRAGLIICHRLADEELGPLAVGLRVALSWEADQASIL